jgi:hypothetical protein
MPEFVFNPRRAPRALIGCEAQVLREGGGSFAGPVVDYGPTGCQVVTPAPLVPRERVVLEVRNPAVPHASILRGRIVWSSAEPPYRSGVEFEPDSQDAAAMLYGHLGAAHPDLAEADDLPDRVSMNARVVPCPREEDAAVLPGEEELLLAIGAGARVGDLRDRLGDRWDQAVNPLFALLARRLLAVEEPVRAG